MALSFQDMNLRPELKTALAKMNFSEPTPIQAAAIPVALEGRDLVGCAQTGTGKTAAFGVPLVARVLENPRKAALVLAPTRELALQIADVLKKLTAFTPQIKTALVIGGADMRPQKRALAQKPQIIVATPGRLTDHLHHKSLTLTNVETLVLDEGDRMLDMGFEPQINEVLKFVSPERQTLLFSATLPERIQKLIKTYMKTPERISVGAQSQPADKITHHLVQTTRQQKNDVLLDVLNAREGSVLIFVNTKHGTNKLATYLDSYGYKVTRIHGGRTQGQRNLAIKGFRAGSFRVMVATDVASRGIDIPHIQHVVNYDLPIDLDDYVHRIGRTARAGADGEAVCLLTPDDRGAWMRLSKMYKLPRPEGFADKRGKGSYEKRPGRFNREDRGDRREAGPRFERKPRFDRGDRDDRREERGARHSGHEIRERFERNDRFGGQQRYDGKQRGERNDRYDGQQRAERNERYDGQQRGERSARYEGKPRFERNDRYEAKPRFERNDRFESRERKPRFSDDGRPNRAERRKAIQRPELARRDDREFSFDDERSGRKDGKPWFIRKRQEKRKPKGKFQSRTA